MISLHSAPRAWVTCTRGRACPLAEPLRGAQQKPADDFTHHVIRFDECNVGDPKHHLHQTSRKDEDPDQMMSRHIYEVHKRKANDKVTKHSGAPGG